MLKTYTFSISQNVYRCLSLHLLKIVFAPFALGHSPCARMIWILTTILILSHHLQQRIDALAESKQRVSPFHRDLLLLPKWRSCSHERKVFETLVVSKRVSPFYRISQFANSEDFDFRVWFSPGFLMQWKIVLMLPFHCFARSNPSLVSLLWLFLHLILFEFFSTSRQNTW